MSEVRRIINSRYHGSNEFLEEYCMIIEDLIYEAYSSRYRAYLRLPKSLGRKTVEEIINRSKDHHIVDYVNFQNHCWKLLEGDDSSSGILGKIYYIISGWPEDTDDSKVRRYLLNIFTNELQQMIDRLNPGLRTRKKQIERILKKSCNTSDFQKRKIWQLKELKNPPKTPASMEKIEDAARQLIPPSLNYPGPGSKRGPSIGDKEMGGYLENILRSVGGTVYHHDLIEMIARVYSLFMPKQVYIDESSGRTIDDLLQETASIPVLVDTADSDSLLVCGEHQREAKDIVHAMNDRLKAVYGYLFLQEKSQTEAADVLGVSNATLSNCKKEIDGILRRHLEQFSLEERLAVLQLVSKMIAVAIPKTDKERN